MKYKKIFNIFLSMLCILLFLSGGLYAGDPARVGRRRYPLHSFGEFEPFLNICG